MFRYLNPAMGELRNELLLTPKELRRAHLKRAQRLFSELDTEKVYPKEYVYYRLTRFRPKDYSGEMIPGETLRRDLLTLLRDVGSRAFGMEEEAAEQGEPILTLDSVREEFRVSERTLRRWRKCEIISRDYIFPDGRRRICVPLSALKSFKSRMQVSWLAPETSAG